MPRIMIKGGVWRNTEVGKLHNACIQKNASKYHSRV